MSQIIANDIVEVFNAEFEPDYATSLQGGADEPYYEVLDGSAVIHFREDFLASALHEVAHWCLAGKARRQLADYGYWYEGCRDSEAQQRFEAVEARPQALEWIFSQILNVRFIISADNLSLPGHDNLPFRSAVQLAARHFVKQGMPDRARRFASALLKLRCVTDLDDVLQPEYFAELPE